MEPEHSLSLKFHTSLEDNLELLRTAVNFVIGETKVTFDFIVSVCIMFME